MRPKYWIERPPLSPTFDLPPKDFLLTLKPGKHVKLIFMQKGKMGERMWVNITDQPDCDLWVGTLLSDPVNISIKMGDEVLFHPLDIIDVWTGQEEEEEVYIGP